LVTLRMPKDFETLRTVFEDSLFDRLRVSRDVLSCRT
jgi:hypothetical protein